MAISTGLVDDFRVLLNYSREVLMYRVKAFGGLAWSVSCKYFKLVNQEEINPRGVRPSPRYDTLRFEQLTRNSWFLQLEQQAPSVCGLAGVSRISELRSCVT